MSNKRAEGEQKESKKRATGEQKPRYLACGRNVSVFLRWAREHVKPLVQVQFVLAPLTQHSHDITNRPVSEQCAEDLLRCLQHAAINPEKSVTGARLWITSSMAWKSLTSMAWKSLLA